MKKFATALLISALPFFANANETIKVAASPVPHAEILEHAQTLAPKDFNIDVVVVTDYVLPNIMLNEGEVDANFMQHQPYLDEFNKANDMTLVSVGGVHLEPLGGYSKKIKDVKDLPQNGKVAIPNDPTNGGRALILLHNNGVITLTDPTNILATIQDIKENPKNLSFVELEAPMLARTIDEVDLALINTNFALDADLNPVKDALIIEDKNSPYVNIVVVKDGNNEKENVKELMKILHSDEMKQFIETKYQGSILPAF
ncbi:methionine ABC transporter substrate-binding protein [Wohlfahrtiimonas chitiniclastica]|uniref:MetQ/NlpA family ABC transporter substrate-binding protein n=1 Tax=Wohlfahrtiimonas chitiniclastica TaxID=400946 RepID=A0AB35BZA3_9GAMM|nr:MetQ/NlpA family ABC transporter substrate-binding protein [Wohlfahrtiimonas chitiniclastica]KZX36645.1 methionine ABC transporter substrate-binding protein [Wohlfahrtiimonas chitiniclastica]MBS7824617.1 MetQ/NlpA family ABC transporter substrate-binding protein [Wohlfahrtiimonas chitiniclastica]MBS7840080.1 MetQ/NlpA family ABC transporter substrate-binding protein [Wohlfahrtiimonas chitiniclastica]OYQ77816.1 methionine ABC transporter substrate-binding protein [Wohlfahrtiimonas chitiniclas